MRMVRRRDLPPATGQFRLRVFAATFAVAFLLAMLVAAVHG